MIYGASGYTGRLLAEEAVRRGAKPLLAGRDAQRIEPLAVQLGCRWRCFDLAEAESVRRGLDGMMAVLNCAGPFSATAAPLQRACLQAKTHYLDITGEIDVIEASFERHAEAVQAGIAILPAVGFDVVPSDCLAAQLAARLPNATELELAFADSSGISPGTAKTVLENIPRGGRVRREGRIRRVPLAWQTRQVPFADRPRWSMTIPWGDVASAYHSTGIQSIVVYTAAPRWFIWAARGLRNFAPMLATPWVQRRLKRRIEKSLSGPSARRRTTYLAQFWGQVRNAAGQCVSATMHTPSGYQLTIETALLAVSRVVQGGVSPGFATPSQFLGQDVLTQIPGASAISFSQSCATS